MKFYTYHLLLDKLSHRPDFFIRATGTPWFLDHPSEERVITKHLCFSSISVTEPRDSNNSCITRLTSQKLRNTSTTSKNKPQKLTKLWKYFQLLSVSSIDSFWLRIFELLQDTGPWLITYTSYTDKINLYKYETLSLLSFLFDALRHFENGKSLLADVCHIATSHTLSL